MSHIRQQIPSLPALVSDLLHHVVEGVDEGAHFRQATLGDSYIKISRADLLGSVDQGIKGSEEPPQCPCAEEKADKQQKSAVSPSPAL